MYKLLICSLFFALLSHAQTKPAAKPATKKPTDKNKVAAKDTVKKEEPKEVDMPIPREFMVYSKKRKNERMKLCINLVSKDSVLNYCINDSLTKDPETSRVLFEQRKGDTLYVLVYVQAFSKPEAATDDGRCSAGKETKLFFAKWNTKTNQAKWKQRTIASCARGVENMSKESIDEWDGTSVLTLNYFRGGTNFIELKFDPQRFELGLQSTNDAEGK